MAISWEKVERRLLLRELAVEHNAKPSVAGERDQEKKRMVKYDKYLRLGLFHDLDWADAIDKEGTVYRADGQHTAHLLATCAAEIFPAGLYVNLTTYRINSVQQDGANLFDRFNHPDQVRSNTDKMCVYRASHDDLAGFGKEYLVNICNGYEDYRKHLIANTRRKLPLYEARERGNYLDDSQLRDFAVWLRQFERLPIEDDEEVAKRSPNWWMVTNRQIVGVIFAGFTAEPRTAAAFWGSTFRDDHPQRDDLSRQLSRALNRMKNGKERVGKNAYYQQVLRAWEQCLNVSKARKR